MKKTEKNNELYREWKPQDVAFIPKLSENGKDIELTFLRPSEYSGLIIKLVVEDFTDEEFMRNSGKIPIKIDIISKHDFDDNVSFLAENAFGHILQESLNLQKEEKNGNN